MHRLTRDRGIVPGLAVVLVGSNPASESYVEQQSEDDGRHRHALFRSPSAVEHERSQSCSALIARLNATIPVNGILVQLPLPTTSIRRTSSTRSIRQRTWTDFTRQRGPLGDGLAGHRARTPSGLRAPRQNGAIASLQGLEAVVSGARTSWESPSRSSSWQENATVTSRTRKQGSRSRLPSRRHLLLAASDTREFVRSDWIKPGATVIDVGINRITDESGSSRIVGDVAFAEACQFAGAITPVPGGVGPLTIACLLANTVRAACAQAGLAPPALGRQSSVDRE